MTIKKVLKNPITAFIEWFNSLASTHNEYLAHMYFILTTQNTTDLAMTSDSAFARFLIVVTKQDFPLRIVSRMVTVRAIFDFLFINKDQLIAEALHGPELTNIAEKQWETALISWENIRAAELSDPYIRLWLQSELKKELHSKDLFDR